MNKLFARKKYLKYKKAAPVLAGALLLAVILSACGALSAETEPEPEATPTPPAVMISLTGELFKDNYVKLEWEAENCFGFDVFAADSPKADFELLESLSGDKTGTLVRLKSGRNYRIKVVCRDENGAAADERQWETETGVSALNASFWPNKKIRVFDGPYSDKEIGKIEPGTRCTVLAEYEDSSRFKIRLEDGSFGYVNSNYCMINLPDYFGELCAYDITNSRSSAYTIHEFEIPGVSGEVMPGYESVLQDDGSYLVPLLYPSAKKLVSAVEKAKEEGYRLKIYDAYRPKTTTVYVYEKAMAILDDALPEESYTGVPADVLTAGGEKTYRNFLVNKSWKLSSFLAKNASIHNKGTALDLTLESLQTGNEIAAATLMHDLSIYSTVKNGNEASKLLYNIMTSCGFSTIKSEWWHFQDNASNGDFSLAFCSAPVS